MGGSDGFRSAGRVTRPVAHVAEPAGVRTDDSVGSTRSGGPVGHSAAVGSLRDVQLPEPWGRSLPKGSAVLRRNWPAPRRNWPRGPIRRRPDRPSECQKYLAEQSRKRQPSVHEIALATSRHFSLRFTDVRSSVRRRTLVTARGVAVYLARHYAGKSLQEIGCYFGGRDHTTVMHSCRQTELMSESDPTIHEAIEQLRKELWKT